MRNTDGVETIVRLAGIDAPERAQPFSNVARRALQELTLGHEIEIFPVKIDQYGRTVAGLRIGETDICLEMIRRGLAWQFKQYEHEQTPAERSLYAEAEAAARREKMGLWKDERPTPPWEFRDKQRAVRAE
jgi:endonuclease YncB( thermonuclease family)